MATKQMELQAEKEYKEALKRQKEAAEEAQVSLVGRKIRKSWDVKKIAVIILKFEQCGFIIQ